MMISKIKYILENVVFKEIEESGINIHDKSNMNDVLTKCWKEFPKENPKVISKTVISMLY